MAFLNTARHRDIHTQVSGPYSYFKTQRTWSSASSLGSKCLPLRKQGVKASYNSGPKSSGFSCPN